MENNATVLQEENAKLKALVNLLLKAQTCELPHSGAVFKLDGVISSDSNDQAPDTVDSKDVDTSLGYSSYEMPLSREDFKIDGVDFEALNRVLDNLDTSTPSPEWNLVSTIPPPAYDETVKENPSLVQRCSGSSPSKASGPSESTTSTKLARVPSEDDYVVISREDVDECVQTALKEAISALEVHKHADEHDVWLALQYAKGLAEARVGMDGKSMKRALNNLAKASTSAHPSRSHYTKAQPSSSSLTSSFSWLSSLWQWSHWAYWGFKVYRNNQTGRVVLTWMYKACTYALVMVL